jgi:alpha-1,6-mannosyltransferase
MPRSRSIATLFGTLALSELGYAVLARLRPTNGVVSVGGFLVVMAVLFGLYFVACSVVSATGGRSRPLAVAIVIAGAVLFRLTLLPAGASGDPAGTIGAIKDDLRGARVTFDRFLLFDNDIWRYVWEGHVLAHGLSPFALAPASPALDRLADPADRSSEGRRIWDDIRDNVSYPDVPAVYPPLAQVTFWFAHALEPGSVFAMKAVIVFADVLAVIVLALALALHGRPPAMVAFYAWNPLAIKAFAGSGHIDAVAVLMLSALLLSIGRSRLMAALWFALAILAKLTPIVLLPLVARRIGWKPTAVALAIVAAGYAPFAISGGHLFDGLRTYATVWRFNGGPFEVVRWALGHDPARSDALARAVCTLIALGAIALVLWRDDGRPESFPAAAAVTLGLVVLLSPAVMPWYVTLVLPLAVLSAQHIWFVWSALVCLAFLVMIDGVQRPLALWIEYGLLALVGFRTRRRTVAAVSLMMLTLLPSAAHAQGSGSLGAAPGALAGGPGAFTVTMSFSGTVADVTSDPKTITVQDKKGKRHQFKVNDATTFTKDEKPRGKVRAAFSDVRTGLIVKIIYRASDEVATDVRIQQSES